VLRGIAASLVILYHVTTHGGVQLEIEFLDNFFAFGHSGVDVFFVLSGFVMMWAHYDDAGRTDKVWRFFRARFARIFPLYWVLMVPYLVYYLASPQLARVSGIEGPLDAGMITRALLLYDQHHQPIIPVAWTLSYEILFYAFFSLYLFAGAAPFTLVSLGWCAMIVAHKAGLVHLTDLPYPFVLSPLILEFFAGCLVAVIVVRLKPASDARWLIAAAFLFLAVGIAENESLVQLKRTVHNWMVPSFLVILAAAHYDVGRRRVYPRVAMLLGDASYSLYLTHFLLLDVLLAVYVRHPWGTHARLPLLVITIVLWACGAVTHRTLERPLLAGVRYRLGLEKKARNQ